MTSRAYRYAATDSAGKPAAKGFALLIAVIFMSVMLTFGLTLASIAYKQTVLTSSAINAQYAFYAADTALECALYADQQLDLFKYNSSMSAAAPQMACDGTAPTSASIVSHTLSQWVITSRVSLDSGTRCADVTVYKPASNTNTTYMFSQGYDTSCTTVQNGGNFVARGISARY